MNLTSLFTRQDSVTLFFILFYLAIFFILSILSVSLLRLRNKRNISTPKQSNITVQPLNPITISSKDITAIAGEDKIATQLDLARAYIETGRKQLAKKILDDVLRRGAEIQQQEAQRLIQMI